MVLLYCFIVGATGSAFSVDIQSNQSVEDLKTAIKAKNADIESPAHKLQLFLAKRKTEETKEEEEGNGEEEWLTQLDVQRGVSDARYKPLTFPDAELGDVGLNSGDLGEVSRAEKAIGKGHVHVLVIVPNPAPIVFKEYLFEPCSDPFFSQPPTVDRVYGWLKFSSFLPGVGHDMLYIRSSYTAIADQALSNSDASMVKYAVITGAPGTGKSVFLYYFMWRLIQEKKRVLFFSKKGPIYFDGSTMFECRSLPSKFNRQFWTTDLWCLVDSMDPTGMQELPIDDCSVLLASAPRQDYIRQFKKLAPTPIVLYMPLWTYLEIREIAHLYPKAQDEWENRCKCLGGVPHLVLEDIENIPEDLLESASNSCSIEECCMFMSIDSEFNPHVQTLLHIDSEAPYQEYTVAYASDMAEEVLARTKLLSNALNMAIFRNQRGWVEGNH